MLHFVLANCKEEETVNLLLDSGIDLTCGQRFLRVPWVGLSRLPSYDTGPLLRVPGGDPSRLPSLDTQPLLRVPWGDHSVHLLLTHGLCCSGSMAAGQL